MGFTGVIFRPEKGGVISPYLNSVQKALYISVQRKHGLFIKKDILHVFIWQKICNVYICLYIYKKKKRIHHISHMSIIYTVDF